MIVPRRHRDLKKQLQYTFDPTPLLMMSEKQISAVRKNVARDAVRRAVLASGQKELLPFSSGVR